MAPLNKDVQRAIPQVVSLVLLNRINKATKYISPTLVVRATVPLEKGKYPRYPKTLVLTIGRPNFLERKLVKVLQKAKEPFPVKKIILKNPPVPRIKKSNKKRK